MKYISHMDQKSLQELVEAQGCETDANEVFLEDIFNGVMGECKTIDARIC